jgi:hypothetical protein
VLDESRVDYSFQFIASPAERIAAPNHV